jgi:hypothetical protein
MKNEIGKGNPDRRYIFTVCTGRNGQNSLTHLLQNSVPNCHALFEAPHANIHLSGRLGSWERKFRRRFVETHELLGRGRVLQAYDQGNDDYIARIAQKRLQRIDQEMTAKNASVYFDVSKYFARGLHVGFARNLPNYSVVLLVRDPVSNMRSFLNRNKNFHLDNTRPDAPRNVLRMATETLCKGELYLWAWCEMYLRYLQIAAQDNVDAATIIHTSRLEDPEYMTAALDNISLPHGPLITSAPRNTNASLGFKATEVRDEDIDIFNGFLEKLPDNARRAIAYFNDYVPGKPANTFVDLKS